MITAGTMPASTRKSSVAAMQDRAQVGAVSTRKGSSARSAAGKSLPLLKRAADQGGGHLGTERLVERSVQADNHVRISLVPKLPRPPHWGASPLSLRIEEPPTGGNDETDLGSRVDRGWVAAGQLERVDGRSGEWGRYQGRGG
jgi:hypothetical protein